MIKIRELINSQFLINGVKMNLRLMLLVYLLSNNLFAAKLFEDSKLGKTECLNMNFPREDSPRAKQRADDYYLSHEDAPSISEKKLSMIALQQNAIYRRLQETDQKGFSTKKKLLLKHFYCYIMSENAAFDDIFLRMSTFPYLNDMTKYLTKSFHDDYYESIYDIMLKFHSEKNSIGATFKFLEEIKLKLETVFRDELFESVFQILYLRFLYIRYEFNNVSLENSVEQLIEKHFLSYLFLSIINPSYLNYLRDSRGLSIDSEFYEFNKTMIKNMFKTFTWINEINPEITRSESDNYITAIEIFTSNRDDFKEIMHSIYMLSNSGKLNLDSIITQYSKEILKDDSIETLHTGLILKRNIVGRTLTDEFFEDCGSGYIVDDQITHDDDEVVPPKSRRFKPSNPFSRCFKTEP